MLKFSILFTVFSTALFGVYDVTKYLENHKFDIEIKDNNLVKYSPGINSFPSYLAKDAYGRQFEFFFYPNWKIEQQLAIQQIFEILGVPTKIKYPTIIRLNGKFQSIMVSPIIPTAQANVNNVDVIEMANRTKMTLTYYLLGVVGFEATSSPEGFVVNDTILPFAQYNARENKRPKLDTYLRTTKIQGNGTVVVPNLREIDSQTRAKFLLEMSLYFRKLAALTAKDSKGQSLLLKIFESYISQNTHSVEKLNTQIGPFTPKRSEFQEKAEGLKLEFENFLKEQVKGAFVVEPIRWIEYGDAKPVADFLYHIPQVLPYSTKLLPDISNEQERRKTAKTHLLRWILTNENTREFALKEWKKQIPPTEEDAIELLMEEARVYDNTVTAVTGESWPKKEELEHIVPLKQYSLNQNLPKTLVVVTPREHADRESQIILNITKDLEAKLNMSLYEITSPTLLEGSQKHLNIADHKLIAKYAKNNHYPRVVIIEMGEISETSEKFYEENNIELMHFDHHSNNHNKLSAGEQFINMLGYQPSLHQLSVFITDRSFVWGISDMLQENLPEPHSRFPYIKQLFANAGQDTEALWRWHPHLVNRDDILLDITGYKEHAKKSTFDLAMGFFPSRFSIFKVDRCGMTRFWGAPEVVQSISKKYKQVVWGGDLNRQAYFIAMPEKSDEKLHEKIKKDVQNHPSVKNLCWETLVK